MNNMLALVLLAVSANAAVLQKQNEILEKQKFGAYGEGERKLESNDSSGFLYFFFCCIYCIVGIPVLICYACNCCCFKGRGNSAPQAPAPAAAPAQAPVVVQVYNNNSD